jgi:hypothetical protein
MLRENIQATAGPNHASSRAAATSRRRGKRVSCVIFIIRPWHGTKWLQLVAWFVLARAIQCSTSHRIFDLAQEFRDFQRVGLAQKSFYFSGIESGNAEASEQVVDGLSCAPNKKSAARTQTQVPKLGLTTGAMRPAVALFPCQQSGFAKRTARNCAVTSHKLSQMLVNDTNVTSQILFQSNKFKLRNFKQTRQRRGRGELAGWHAKPGNSAPHGIQLDPANGDTHNARQLQLVRWGPAINKAPVLDLTTD